MQKQTNTVVDLGGTWSVRSTDGQYHGPGTVPGSLFADLEAADYFGEAGKGGGIAWRENNRACQDIAHRDFVWSRDFDLDPSFLGGKGPVFLACDGLDTLAAIRINGVEVGRSANMHRRREFNVGHVLKAGTNSIEVEFADSLAHCDRELARRPIWFAYDKTPEIAYPGFNMIRKSHCSYGWDWGPIVPDVGIWRAIKLVRHGELRLGEPRIVQHHEPGKVRIDIDAGVEVWTGSAWVALSAAHPSDAEPLMAGTRIEARLTTPSGMVMKTSLDQAGRGSLVLENPALWWPNGLGEQALHELVLEGSGPALAGGSSSRCLNVGLRTLRVRREPDAWGESFEFEVNGQSFFACGADYIPEDVSLPRVSRERTETLIRDAAAANFNCIRVWGGAVYPGYDFFDLCDRYGLVVWQDLMFACALYDIDNPDFRADVLEEVRDNLRRIRHHACLGLVCGNNEMEVAFVEWGLPDDPATRTEYLLQYQHLFPEIAAQECPDVYYWPASPSSGGNFQDPNAPDRGDCHFWEVWHGNKDFAEYTRHYFRFMSEFGFESFPAMKTIESFTLPGDRDIYSPVMEDHQRCVGGNAKIMTYMSRYFRTPRDLGATVYLSWLSQAEALRHGIEHWRRNRGCCMGSVYWQLNDNWPVASWSSIDHAGRWKALHYQARRSYAPQLVSAWIPEPPALPKPWDRKPAPEGRLPAPAGNGHFAAVPAVVEIHLSNEGRAEAIARIQWELRDLGNPGGSPLRAGTAEARCGGFSSRKALAADFSDLLQGRDLPRRAVFLWRAELQNGSLQTGAVAFLPWKQMAVPAARLGARVLPLDPAMDVTNPRSAGKAGARHVLELTGDAPAFFVEIDHRDYDLVLSDNFVTLDGRTSRRLVVESVRRDGREVEADPALLQEGLVLKSLADASLKDL